MDIVWFHGLALQPCPVPPAQPPALYVVVDTEAEFDWSKPFARDLVKVSAMAAQERAQAVFDRYGLRPIYVVDYPVATQPEGYQPLRAILERGGCEIGAHLHPWTNPPFAEAVSIANSFPGNLPADVEEAKLLTLLAAIRQSFGITPRFYKSGRYGLGPHTLPMLARHGIGVDFSILPGADFRATGGPDFRALTAVPYLAVGGQVTAMPMTRGYVGPLAVHEAILNRHLDRPVAQALKFRGTLSWLGLFNRASLTPEGMSAEQQIALIETLNRRGCRAFVLSYHSPSLVPGHTPYVRSAADVDDLLERIDAVCRHVLGPLGGRPGNPLDLLPERLEARHAA